MPAESKAQHGFMGLVKSVKSGERRLVDVPAGVRKKVARAVESMSMEQIDEYTRTPVKGLPNRATSHGRSPVRNVRSV